MQIFIEVCIDSLRVCINKISFQTGLLFKVIDIGEGYILPILVFIQQI